MQRGQCPPHHVPSAGTTPLGHQQAGRLHVPRLVERLQCHRHVELADGLVIVAAGLRIRGQRVRDGHEPPPQPFPGRCDPVLVAVGGQQLTAVERRSTPRQPGPLVRRRGQCYGHCGLELGDVGDHLRGKPKLVTAPVDEVAATYPEAVECVAQSGAARCQVGVGPHAVDHLLRRHRAAQREQLDERGRVARRRADVLPTTADGEPTEQGHAGARRQRRPRLLAAVRGQAIVDPPLVARRKVAVAAAGGVVLGAAQQCAGGVGVAPAMGGEGPQQRPRPAVAGNGERPPVQLGEDGLGPLGVAEHRLHSADRRYGCVVKPVTRRKLDALREVPAGARLVAEQGQHVAGGERELGADGLLDPAAAMAFGVGQPLQRRRVVAAVRRHQRQPPTGEADGRLVAEAMADGEGFQPRGLRLLAPCRMVEHVHEVGERDRA